MQTVSSALALGTLLSPEYSLTDNHKALSLTFFRSLLKCHCLKKKDLII